MQWALTLVQVHSNPIRLRHDVHLYAISHLEHKASNRRRCGDKLREADFVDHGTSPSAQILASREKTASHSYKVNHDAIWALQHLDLRSTYISGQIQHNRGFRRSL